MEEAVKMHLIVPAYPSVSPLVPLVLRHLANLTLCHFLGMEMDKSHIHPAGISASDVPLPILADIKNGNLACRPKLISKASMALATISWRRVMSASGRFMTSAYTGSLTVIHLILMSVSVVNLLNRLPGAMDGTRDGLMEGPAIEHIPHSG